MIHKKNQIARQIASSIESIECASSYYTRLIAKTKSNSLLAFGYNTDGSLGLGNTTNIMQLSEVLLPEDLKDYELYDFNTECFLVLLCEDAKTLYACGTNLDSALRYTTPTLQAQKS